MFNEYRKLFVDIENESTVFTSEILRGMICFGVFNDDRGYYIHDWAIRVYRCSDAGIGEFLGEIIPPKKDYENLIKTLEEIRSR